MKNQDWMKTERERPFRILRQSSAKIPVAIETICMALMCHRKAKAPLAIREGRAHPEWAEDAEGMKDGSTAAAPQHFRAAFLTVPGSEVMQVVLTRS